MTGCFLAINLALAIKTTSSIIGQKHHTRSEKITTAKLFDSRTFLEHHKKGTTSTAV